MIGIFAWFGTGLGKLTVAAAVLASLFTLRQFDKANLRAQGETRAVAKIEKANDKAVDLGKRAAAKSRAPAAGRVLGQRDPTTRDD